jgi:hypothetical protein
VKSEPGPVPQTVLDIIERRSGSAFVRELATAFAEQALRRDVDLVPHSGSAPRYFRVVFGGRTVAYVHPRATAVRVDYRLPGDHWSYGWGFGQDNPRGQIGLDIGGQTAFEVGMTLLDDSIGQAGSNYPLPDRCVV